MVREEKETKEGTDNEMRQMQQSVKRRVEGKREDGKGRNGRVIHN